MEQYYHIDKEKKLKKISIWILLFCALCGSYMFTCTGFVVKNGHSVLIGNNEDYFTGYNDTVIKIVPETSTTYGCLLVGFNQQNISMGGINEKGLFCDWFYVPENGWKEKSDRPTYPGRYIKPELMLKKCASIDEAISFFFSYNMENFKQNRVLVADKSGNAVVIEWGGEDLDVIWKEKSYMVSTNFLLNHPERGMYPCSRYSTATEMLKKETPSLDLCRRILDSVHVDYEESQTKYSNVYELQKGDIYYYNNHNFDEFIKFNIFDELNRGKKTYLLPDYFSKIKLLSPAKGAIIDSQNVTFSCYGDPYSEYTLVYSKNADLSNAVNLNSDNTGVALLNSGSFFYFGSFLFLGEIVRKKKMIMMFIVLICISLFFVNCNVNNGGEITQPEVPFVFSQTISGLEADTTYYWKIIAKKKEGLISESIIRSFKTK